MRHAPSREFYERGSVGARHVPMWWPLARFAWGRFVPELRRWRRGVIYILAVSRPMQPRPMTAASLGGQEPYQISGT
jgi:hypothetical protein